MDRWTKQISRWVVAATVAGCVMWANSATAQMVVNDPANLVQNTMSQVAEARAVIEQIKTVQNQIEQIEQMKRDLEQLSPEQLADLEESFRRLEDLYRQGEQISMEWGQIGSQFDSTYEDYDPEQHDGQEYQERVARWQKQTDASIRTAMMSHGVVTQYDQRGDDLEALVRASDSATGTLAAIQAGNRISALMMRQMMELTEIIAADSRARLSHMKERQMRDRQDNERRRHYMSDGWGEDTPRPQGSSELPKIQ